MARLSLLEKPAAAPVALADIKAWLRVDSDADDALLGSLLAAATQAIENHTGRALMTQRWRLLLDNWPERRAGRYAVHTAGGGGVLAHPSALVQQVILPKSPLQAVDSIDLLDTAGDWQSIDSALYRIDSSGASARLHAAYGAMLPAPHYARSGIRIDFTAGYGNAGTDVPEALQQAVRLLVCLWYEQRVPAAARALPDAVSALLLPYRLYAL